MKARKLAVIAEDIKATFPQYEIILRDTVFNTDRKIPGTRLRSIGKGRKGKILEVYDRSQPYPQRPIFSHNSGETYRTNSEVEEWLAQMKKEI